MPVAAHSSVLPLRVSENGRFLSHADGRPFFWLGDTAWCLFHRLDRAEADHYLRDRASKGFTVIQAVALSELDGPHAPAACGHAPLLDNDPLRPNELYWAHVDHVIARANALDLVVALLPTWGDKWNKKHGAGPEVFIPENAEAYGEWLGRRYRRAGLVWILGGDRPIETETHRAIIRRMAAGLRRGDGGAHLITFHSQGAAGSAQYFHSETWLDFNLRQNGHAVDYTGRYDQTRVDYDRVPPKPVLDGEPVYEDIGIDFAPERHGHAIAADTRRALYWNLFTGACGHTYGHNAVWQMWRPGLAPVLAPTLPWHEALHSPGAGQMAHARRLLESRPFFSRIPDQDLLAAHPTPTFLPGAGRAFFAATRDCSATGVATYLMIYAPVGRGFSVRTDKLPGRRLRAWWFDPRDGSTTDLGIRANSGLLSFTPPDAGEARDWILVLDDASIDYPPPGSRPDHDA